MSLLLAFLLALIGEPAEPEDIEPDSQPIGPIIQIEWLSERERWEV